MTAENLSASRIVPAARRRFNEAAADDRGKLRIREQYKRGCFDASMRPRPMTAENMLAADAKPTRHGASMRPRPMTAENIAEAPFGRFPLHKGFNEAAADDRGKRIRSCRLAAPRGGFNEAAADDRGKRGRRGAAHGVRSASMRPRPMTAENASGSASAAPSSPRFNEAAADDRGKRR